MEEYCAVCKNIECRCNNCYALTDNDGAWYCDEADMNCADVAVCMSYYEDSVCVTGKHIG